jgi:hypothetical protein
VSADESTSVMTPDMVERAVRLGPILDVRSVLNTIENTRHMLIEAYSESTRGEIGPATILDVLALLQDSEDRLSNVADVLEERFGDRFEESFVIREMARKLGSKTNATTQ